MYQPVGATQPSRPPSEKSNQLRSSPIQRRRRTTPHFGEHSCQGPSNITQLHEADNVDNLQSNNKSNTEALIENTADVRRKDTVKIVLDKLRVKESDNTGFPIGASPDKNQYLLLTAPRNQRFLSRLGLNESVASKIPQNRREIVELFNMLDTECSGWITTGKLLQHFISLNLPMTPSEVERLVKMCDLNEDNYIQPVDLVNALQKMQPMQSISMCMPSNLGRAKHLADSILVATGHSSSAQAAELNEEKPKDVLNDIFDPQSRIQQMPVPQPILPKSYGPGLIIPSHNSDHYADTTEQMETMNNVMDWNNVLGTKPPGIEETHRKIQQRNTRLDNINKCVQSLTARCRERDTVAETRDQERIHTKIRQRARYQKAALFGADLYSRVEQQKKNRLEKLSRSPIHQQTFAISPRGTVKPVRFVPGTVKYSSL